ncbi:MAG: potassium/proton antiporter [Bacteroidetes bacterium]|nr:MAG: potassium/proton antiporter [Bacteroidota bacterium]
MLTFDHLILIASSLILLSVAIAKVSDNLGVPTLLLFLGIGMLAGSDGPGGLYFDDARLAQSIGIIALIFILFAGGLDTKWSDVRPVVREAGILATAGVLVTAVSVAAFMVTVYGLTWLNGLLLGAIVSSTDAAAVFSVLRSRNVSLRGTLKPLLELESGSNDPMAVFLTIGTLQLILSPSDSVADIVMLFVYQMGIGAATGYGFGRLMTVILNRLRFPYEGIYPVFTIAYAGMVYAATALVNGSGFLAVYIAGLVIGNSDIIQKKSLLRFFDGLGWLGQIAMFLTMGLLVFPHQLVHIAGSGLLISFFLIVVARPLGVFLSLSFSRYTVKEKSFISWVGLRGAVPIILATFPLLAKTPDSDVLFNIVFFIVLTSALVQGWTIPAAAMVFGVDAPSRKTPQYPIEFAANETSETQLVDIVIPYHSGVIGRPIVDLGLPPDSLVVLITRNDTFVVPSGGTHIEEGDTLLVLVNKENLPAVRRIFSEQRPDA